MYWSGIFLGVALGLVGGLTGLFLANSTYGLAPLFTPTTANAFAVCLAAFLAPITSIATALFALKKQVIGGLWVPEIAGMLMYGSGLVMMGFLVTGGLTLVPAGASALGGLIIMLATDELKTATNP